MATDVLEQSDTKIEINEPKKFKVLLHNDDKTTFDFVIQALTTIFHRTIQQSIELTLQIHEMGAGIAGVYSEEVAEMKTLETMALAKEQGFPLKATYEEF